ncbi:MAG: MFS transporter [Gammaproteobacteria bacterium]|nr:MFS transporter [Gammaproteobacteria bacterium]MCY4274417.1 MFS transporter [Gammaproteobacteria bacterium]
MKNLVISTTASWSDLLNRQHLPLLLTLCLAMWLHATNTLLTATTMPSAVDEMGGLNLISWTFALYLMGSIVSGTASSILVTQHGLRTTMITATLVYVVGTVVCATAVNMPVVLIGRTFQGMGGGCLVGTVFIAQSRFFDPKYVPRVVAMISVVWMMATFASPMIGGAFSTWADWRYAFWAFAFQAGLLAVIIRRLMSTSDPARKTITTRLPLIRLALLAMAILMMSAAGMKFHVIVSPILIIGGIICIVIFVYRDVHSMDNRMFPQTIGDFSHSLNNGIMTILLLCLSIMSLSIYGPLILIKLHNMTPFTAGVILMLESLAWGIMALTFSSTPSQYEHILIRFGSALVLIGLVACSITFPYGPIWLIALCSMISTGGFGMMWGFIIKRIQGSSPQQEKDRASSLIPITQQMGFALGSALCGLIANSLGLTSGLSIDQIQTVAFWIFAGFIPLALCGNVTAWRFTR